MAVPTHMTELFVQSVKLAGFLFSSVIR